MKQIELFAKPKEVMEQTGYCPVKSKFINMDEIKNTCFKENRCPLIKNCKMCFFSEKTKKGDLL